MPRGDGTGPVGGGKGRGRMGGPFAAGPGGNCICPSCNTIAPHVPGQPCSQMACPKCGAQMTRQQ
jgi:hypothetical protein